MAEIECIIVCMLFERRDYMCIPQHCGSAAASRAWSRVSNMRYVLSPIVAFKNEASKVHLVWSGA